MGCANNLSDMHTVATSSSSTPSALGSGKALSLSSSALSSSATSNCHQRSVSAVTSSPVSVEITYHTRLELTRLDYAIASAVPLGCLNYFLVGWLNGDLDKYYVESWQSKHRHHIHKSPY
jgi:hypothetical protein